MTNYHVAFGMAQETSAFALPATATPAALSESFLPFVIVSTRTLVV